MKKIIKQHNKDIEQWLENPEDERFKKRHLRCIKCLQHERLVHLLITLFFALATLILFLAVIFMPFKPCVTVLFAIFLVMTGFYIWHYYFLENTVQNWYKVMKKK